MNHRAILRSLANRNFRLFFFGQSISLIGTWMQQVAMQWVIFLLTRKEGQAHQSDAAFWLGMVGFASQIPAFFLAPVAGVLVDRWNRHRLIIVTQTLAMIQAFVLACLTHHPHHQRGLDHGAQCVAGSHQRLRHAGPAGVPHWR